MKGMRVQATFHVFDSHTAGSPTRLLLEGVPSLPGASMLEKRRSFTKHFDYIRTALIQEPRGNSGVVAVLVPSPRKGADYGVIFGDYRGYLDMCVHGTIGIVTTLVECGLTNTKRARRGFVFDTPAGLVRAAPNFRENELQSVTVSNVPSYYIGETTVRLPEFGRVPISIGYGGNVYAYVNSKDLGLKVAPGNLRRLLAIARLLFTELRKPTSSVEQFRLADRILGISLYEDTGERSARNIMVAEDDLFDRSPCGTGTCGRMAVLFNSGKLTVGDSLVSKSIIGSEFVGRITGVTKVHGQRAILPEVTGSAHMTAVSDIVLSKGDKFAKGFLPA